jgi:thiosulfate/3-mercaptopyruvate sulfurtransferase
VASPLIEVSELSHRLGDPNLRVADVRWRLGQPERGRADYSSAHIPGAIYVDLDHDLAAAAPGAHPQGGRHPLPDPAFFARRMGELGFRDSDTIVVYDDSGGTVAARLWWMLDDLGFAEVRLLNGGLAAWTTAGLPTTSDAPPGAPALGSLKLRDHWSRAINRTQLMAALGSGPLSGPLLDVRAPERYRGEVEPVDRVPGHIPTARNLPTTGNLGADACFLAPESLRDRLGGVGADAPEVVVSCGSGVNAAHTALAMRLAGLPAPLLYDGSYSDWSAAELPVATGSEPGSL